MLLGSVQLGGSNTSSEHLRKLFTTPSFHTNVDKQ